jgi:hypothetical protein
MVWNIGHVNEYEAQSAIIIFFCIIIRKMSGLCDHNAFSFLLLGVLQYRKKANFSRR